VKFDTESYHKEQSIHPKRILWGLLMLNGFLFIIVLFFRSGEIQLSENYSLKFVSTEDLFSQKEIRVVNVDSVLQDVAPIDTTSTGLALSAADSLIPIPELSKRIQFNPTDSINGLLSFFKALYKTELTGDLIRILHYGDSQLEGDRISDYLRNKLQMRFGGYGPGIVLPIDISNSRVSIRQSESPDWKKYAVYGKGRRLSNGYYGIGTSSYQFDGKFSVKIGEDTVITKVYDIIPVLDSATVNKDTTAKKSEVLAGVVDSSLFHYDTIITPIYEERDVSNSYLKYRVAKRSYPRVRTFNNIRLIYSSNKPFSIYKAVDDQSELITLKPEGLFGIRQIHKGTVNKQLLMTFNAEESPIVYGVMLDGDSGVAVDNFPMRGSSGLGFEMLNQNQYRRMLEETNSKLILMQYGINVVPSPRKNYDFYERMFSAQLRAIRKASPDISILVIGPSDMSRKRNGEYVSYPNIPLIRDAMRNAAYKNGCVFWDLYEAMGGENSMVAWVNNDPPLAGKDFTHFSTRGAQFVGEMLYNAIMSEYINWKKNNGPSLIESSESDKSDVLISGKEGM